MIRLISFFAIAALAHAGVQCRNDIGAANGTWTTSTAWDGTSRLTCVGAERPVHYILTNDGESIAAMRTLVQAVADDAWRGGELHQVHQGTGVSIHDV